MYADARELVRFSGPRGVRFIVNDRPDIAAMAGASGVHVGQDDLPVEDARKICKPPCWVGVSTHNLEQLREADRHFGGLYCGRAYLPDGYKRESRPGCRT